MQCLRNAQTAAISEHSGKAKTAMPLVASGAGRIFSRLVGGGDVREKTEKKTTPVQIIEDSVCQTMEGKISTHFTIC